LNAVIDAARARPYVLGVHDCFRLACAVMEALTGVDRWPEFSGYKTKREALAKLARYGHSFEAAGDWFFGAPRLPVAQAQRGDIVAARDPLGEKHLGVCVGARVCLLLEAGLVMVALDSPLLLCAWRVD